jgi:hypothetical protein
MDDMAHYVADDDLAMGPLSEFGWEVSTVSWSDPTADWDEFELAVLRTTWDYQQRPDEFLKYIGCDRPFPGQARESARNSQVESR